MAEDTGVIGATPEAKDEFSIEVARAWEEALDKAPTPATRKVVMRTAMVFAASKGGAYRVLRGLTRWGLGGAVAGGHQFISWIHEADLCNSVEWLIDRDDFSGPVNLASPNPIPHRDMMRIIRRECGVPFGLPATRRMLEIAAFVHRTEAELIIKSRRVVPGRLLAAGFQFRFPRMEDAVGEIEERLRMGRG
jgi:NAD dependent epimerase/dehydratase family enzyme